MDFVPPPYFADAGLVGMACIRKSTKARSLSLLINTPPTPTGKPTLTCPSEFCYTPRKRRKNF